LARQNLYEFWAVATRPNDANGLNYNHEQAIGELSVLKKIYHLIDDIPAIYPAWENLVRDHEVKGKNAHDARLVAAMNVHGVNQILTFNESDFSRYDGVTVLTPAAVLS
jgi:predicted nucleic acid-binding protein